MPQFGVMVIRDRNSHRSPSEPPEREGQGQESTRKEATINTSAKGRKETPSPVCTCPQRSVAEGNSSLKFASHLSFNARSSLEEFIFQFGLDSRFSACIFEVVSGSVCFS